jgi:hypothetical protein
MKPFIAPILDLDQERFGFAGLHSLQLFGSQQLLDELHSIVCIDEQEILVQVLVTLEVDNLIELRCDVY